MSRTSSSSSSGASRSKGAQRPTATGRLRALRVSAPVVLVVVASAVLLVGLAALPASTWLDQKRLTGETRDQLDSVEAEVSELQLKLELLETDEEVERMGRENFDLVYPGEESYRILPAPDTD